MYRTEMFEPELVFYAGSTLLENPIWDDKNERLYFIAISDEMIYQLDSHTSEIKTFKTDGAVGAADLDEKGLLLSAEKKGIFRIDPSTGERTFLAHPNQDERLRYNDGKLDAKGRFFVGTMGEDTIIKNAAALYVVENGESRVVLSDLSLSNGLDWSRDGKTFYHTDSTEKTVTKYDYDVENGSLSNGKALVRLEEHTPDGLCVDICGDIWIAEYGGGKVSKWDSETGEKILEIPIPVTNVTSCCLGGKNNEFLYITSAKDPEDEEDLSGGLFRARIR